MKLKMPRLMITLVIAGLVVTSLVVLITTSTNRAPDFYRQSLAIPHHQSVIEGRLFERRLVELSNQIRLDNTWSTIWTEAQVNGWLAADLQEKFPQVLPDSICQPRVAFSDSEIRVAFQLRSNAFRGIVQITGDIFATEVENQVGFRIARVRSGLLPVPVSLWADRLESSLRNSDIILEWSNLENDPVALITLPTKFSGGNRRQSILEAVQLSDRGIALSGRTIHDTSSSTGTPDETVADSSDRIQH